MRSALGGVEGGVAGMGNGNKGGRIGLVHRIPLCFDEKPAKLLSKITYLSVLLRGGIVVFFA